MSENTRTTQNTSTTQNTGTTAVNTPADAGDAAPLKTYAVVPEEGDNAAVAIADTPAGTRISFQGKEFTLAHNVMEGHRFIIAPVSAGDAITSWNTIFASATRDLAPGDYVCTEQSLQTLRDRHIEGLPESASAANVPLDPYRLDESAVNVGDQVPLVDTPATFAGYRRTDGAVGTRNHIAVIGVTSRGASFATRLAKKFDGRATDTFDGVVPVAHTEAGEDNRPNNVDFVLSVLAGCLAHPNLGGVLLIDTPGACITAEDVRNHLADKGYRTPTGFVETFTRSGSFAQDLEDAAAIVEPWIDQVAATERTDEPVSHLAIGLQCGGSDAFSGLSANQLAGSVGGKVIANGGTACLAETDELIGAEGYVLKNVKSVDVARQFIAAVDKFKERAAWHGHTAEGNPSGGNIYRGLYNIVLKSVGAARKLPREVRLDQVVGYGQPITEHGYVFMDSPGNDLESVAGQVASGCNLIFFTTGNGSITNFPFVPTLKFVTTSGRYQLLEHEMDVNGGRYLDGEEFGDLVDEIFDQAVDAASGEHTAGEQAGHSQVSIWRDWKQTKPVEGVSISVDGRIGRRTEDLPSDLRDALLEGKPLPLKATSDGAPDVDVELYENDGRKATERLALVLPTSLCSGQIGIRLADLAGDWVNDQVSRSVSLPHTEGCGVTAGASLDTYERVMVGHLTHPNVGLGLLLEHGCEKTHNDFFRNALDDRKLDPNNYGWASIQLDGGLAKVTDRVHEWFDQASIGLPTLERRPGSLGDLTVALDARGPLRDAAARALAALGEWIVAAGGTVVIASTSQLLSNPLFTAAVTDGTSGVVLEPTVAHGQRPEAPGWHIMRNPTTDWTETVSGLGATGAHLVLVHVADGSVTGERLVPVAQVTSDPATEENFFGDLDAILTGDSDDQAAQLANLVADIASGRHPVKSVTSGNLGFQITRGLLGTSM